MTINTDADVIRVIQENPRLLIQALTDSPELISEVRHVVLTDELLAMPGQLAEVVKTQSEMQKTQSEMQESQNEMLKTQNEVLKTQDEDARRASQRPQRHRSFASDVQAATRGLQQFSGQLRD